MTIKSTSTYIAGKSIARRQFLAATGGLLTTAALLTAASCSKPRTTAPVNNYDAGQGDDGVFNFLYANEQVLSDFYIAVFTTPYDGMAGDELKYMNDIHDHDIVHRYFFQEILGDKGFPILSTDFSMINFSNRDAVLAAAKVLKNNSIAAYNSVAYLLTSANYLSLVGKIASVEGRHAATIGSIISYGSLLDNTCVDNSTSLEIAKSPADVLAVINTYLKTKITANSI